MIWILWRTPSEIKKEKLFFYISIGNHFFKTTFFKFWQPENYQKFIITIIDSTDFFYLIPKNLDLYKYSNIKATFV